MFNLETEQLKRIKNNPNRYLIDFYSNLNRRIALKLDSTCAKEKYLEIEKKLDSCFLEAFNKWDSKCIDTFDDEIKFLEESKVADKSKQLYQVKLNIEKELFLKRSVIFVDQNAYARNPFLLIINDEYISADDVYRYELDYEFMTQYKLFVFFLKDDVYLDSNFNSLEKNCVFNFNIKESIKKITLNAREIKELHPNLFDKLINLDSIDLSNNLIDELPQNIFKCLKNLRSIGFSNNKIKELYPNLLNGLTNLVSICFGKNKIKQIDQNFFKQSVKLESIHFEDNQINELYPDQFSGLSNLECINFNNNQIDELHESLFTGLDNLKCIHFNNNKIKKLHVNLFEGLTKLRVIHLNKNQIRLVKLFL